MIYLDFAKCGCGFHTPIQPSMSATKETNQKWIETGGELPFVACEKCKRIYKPQELATGPSSDGLSSYQPDAPQHVFHVSIPCAVELQCTPIAAIAVRNSDTSEEQLKAEIEQCRGVVTCSRGHVQSYPSGWK